MKHGAEMDLNEKMAAAARAKAVWRLACEVMGEVVSRTAAERDEAAAELEELHRQRCESLGAACPVCQEAANA